MNMLFGKFVMAKMHYSGWTPGNNFHPFKLNKTYDITKITFKIYPLSKWRNCGQIPTTTLLGRVGNQLTRNSKWQLIVTCNNGSK